MMAPRMLPAKSAAKSFASTCSPLIMKSISTSFKSPIANAPHAAVNAVSHWFIPNSLQIQAMM